ncbi:MAG TPA: hypothetical protein VK196_17905 [Magnetospirillum sp.]|nr:hypothetical protein [Magnetospirillum sp.]
MDEVAIKGAIARDFNIQGGDVVRREAEDGSVVLKVEVNDPLPECGRAQVTYVQAPQSRGLERVGIVWKGKADAMVGGAGTLRDYFIDLDYIVMARDYLVAQNFPAVGNVAEVLRPRGRSLAFRGYDG